MDAMPKYNNYTEKCYIVHKSFDANRKTDKS